MRISIGVLAVSLSLLCSAGESHALNLTEAQRQLGALESVLATEPKVVVEQRSSAPYYNVIVENICDGTVERLARQWLTEPLATFLDRALLIEASISFPDSKRREFNALIFAGANTSDSQWKCQSSIVQGVPHTERVRVILKLIAASELGPNTSAVFTGALASAAGLVTGGWGAVVVGVAAGATKAYAAQTKDINQKVLEAGGEVYPAVSVELGAPFYGKKNRPTSAIIAGASFFGNGQDWFTLRRQPRDQLIQYNAQWESAAQKIPAQIDLVSVDLTWDEMLKAAYFDTLDWSRPSAVSAFCTSFRNELHRSLQRDSLAVLLGLYAHFVQYHNQFNGERAYRGCLELKELNELQRDGYILTPSS